MNEADFLEAICADPTDDGVRLIFSDWLEEHGNVDRAEFIRIQCQLFNLPEEELSRRSRLVKRQDELLALHKAKWLGEWPESVSYFFGRGFVNEIQADSDSLLKEGQLLFARHPFTDLRVTGGETDKLLKELAGLDRLTSLNLWGTNVTDAGLPNIAH